MLGNRCSCSTVSLKWDKIGTGSGSIKCWALSTNGYSWQRKIAHDMVDKSFVDDFVASRHCKCESGSYASIHWGSSCVSMICSSLLLICSIYMICFSLFLTSKWWYFWTPKGIFLLVFFSFTMAVCLFCAWRILRCWERICVCVAIFLNVVVWSWTRFSWINKKVAFLVHFPFVIWLNFLAVKSLKRELWERLCNGRGNVGTRCSRGAVVELSCGIQYMSSQWKLHDRSLHAWLRCINGDVVERRKFGSCGIIVGACKGCWELHWPIPVGW